MKALVVEDDLKSQCLLAKVLAERGHEVTTFENAEQAILAYQKEFYPLLFVDVDLPGMDGLQYCRWIRNQPLGEGSYFIAAIEPTNPAEAKQVLAAGANDFLNKPYQLDQLRARLAIGERQMAQFFEQQQLANSLRSETQRWTLAEAALARTRQEFEASLAAKETELGQLREKLSSAEANREFVASAGSKLARRDEDLEHLREEIGEVWKRCGHLERALEESKQECEAGRARTRESEHALEAAHRELHRLRSSPVEPADAVKETLRTREEELARLEQELAETREELATSLRAHREELARIDDRKPVHFDDGSQEEMRLYRDARRRLETRWRAILRLGSELNEASTVGAVARVAGKVTQELVGWDLFSLETYAAEGNWIGPVLSLECVDGAIREAPPLHPGPEPTSLMRRVIEDGPQLILRPAMGCTQSDGAAVGHRTRRSASLLCVPIEAGHRIFGFLSIRSSRENAYNVEDLETLQMVAAQCAAAMDRVNLRLAGEAGLITASRSGVLAIP